MSTAIGIRFVAGRYHASPWGRHVNEAAVEWPPSPLRLLRALIAVWHRKADKDRFPEERLRQLVHVLAGEMPVYRLPRASLSHTRHFMPVVSGRRERRSLVFDAFLRLDSDDELLVIWPATTLRAPERDTLDHLLGLVGYLGRAESWAECRRLDSWSELPDCGPRMSAERWRNPGAESRHQPVELPVAMASDRYEAWRAEQIVELDLEQPRLMREKRLRATLPDDLLGALRLDNGAVRAVGWSRAPGTDRAMYLRPEDCFAPPHERAAVNRIPARPAVDTVRLALIGRPLPRLEDAIRIGEVVRAAAMAQAGDVPSVLSGHDMATEKPHQHAFYLPEDATGTGHIDHVLIHAPASLGKEALRALGRIDRIWESDAAEWRVFLESYGSAGASLEHPYLTPSRVWVSVTPYLHPWHRKNSFTVEDQILRELVARGLPAPSLESLAAVQVGGRERRAVHFHRFRTRSRRRVVQPDTRGSFWRLVFTEAVPGPLALGFGCHLGLGIFRGVEGPA